MMINKDITNSNPTEEMQRCLEYVEALEAERNKIQVFQRELPLCLEIITRAIEGCRQQLCGGATANYMNGQSECSEQTSSDFVPVLEEFIPMKRASCSNNADDGDDGDDDDEEGDEDIHVGSGSSKVDKIVSSKKSDWLRSVQLCIQTPDPPPVKQDSPRKVAVAEVKKNGCGAFHPFKKEKEKEKSCGIVTPAATVVVPAAAASSTAETGGSGGASKSAEDKEGQSNRKARRCWSPELHRRFLQALSQLGGAHVATPKQIRDLMKVDGLTNDEVKSHLQKYRLHTRRLSPSVHNNNSAPATQFVVVGGIWMPPPEYATMGSAPPSGGDVNGGGAIGVYAPRASVPPSIAEASTSLTKRQQHQSKKAIHSDDKGCHSEGGMHSNSPSTSSSTHTTTASPVF